MLPYDRQKMAGYRVLFPKHIIDALFTAYCSRVSLGCGPVGQVVSDMITTRNFILSLDSCDGLGYPANSV